MSEFASTCRRLAAIFRATADAFERGRLAAEEQRRQREVSR